MALLAGCAGGLEFAAIGAAANATRAGAAVVQGGKVDGAVLAPPSAVRLAVAAALEDAGLTLRDDARPPDERTTFVGEDDRGSVVKVRLRGRTERLTRIQVDVGWFGHDATARLVALRIHHHLRRLGHATDQDATDQDARVGMNPPTFSMSPANPPDR